jgi:hypothetical protein
VTVSAVEAASDLQVVGGERYVFSGEVYNIDVSVSHTLSPLITDLTLDLTSTDLTGRGLRRISSARITPLTVSGTVTLGGSGAVIVIPQVAVDSPLIFTIAATMDGPGNTSLDLTYSAKTFKGEAAAISTPSAFAPFTVVSYLLCTLMGSLQRHPATPMVLLLKTKR